MVRIPIGPNEVVYIPEGARLVFKHLNRSIPSDTRPEVVWQIHTPTTIDVESLARSIEGARIKGRR